MLVLKVEQNSVQNLSTFLLFWWQKRITFKRSFDLLTRPHKHLQLKAVLFLGSVLYIDRGLGGTCGWGVGDMAYSFLNGRGLGTKREEVSLEMGWGVLYPLTTMRLQQTGLSHIFPSTIIWKISLLWMIVNDDFPSSEEKPSCWPLFSHKCNLITLLENKT